MAQPRLGRLPAFQSIGLAEKLNLAQALRKPLSGYLGGVTGAGYWIERLSAEWREAFKCRYAIPCNSATSGLLAACMAAGVGPGDVVWAPAYSMSATAACAKVLGATVWFMDIETIRYSMNINNFTSAYPKAIIVTNLFGHPAYLHAMRAWCDEHKVVMIEDNAQAPFAMEDGKYAGTIGHIGVFSLNVHKHIQAGEGGVVCTDNTDTADRIHGAINHGELAGLGCGLNLRMTETTAAIASAQLKKAPQIIQSRRNLAHELTDMVAGIPWIRPPIEDHGCRHVYYLWVARVDRARRDNFVLRLMRGDVPIRAKYSPPLNRVFKSQDKCPVTEELDEHEVILFEVCAYDPNAHHLRKMRCLIQRAADAS